MLQKLAATVVRSHCSRGWAARGAPPAALETSYSRLAADGSACITGPEATLDIAAGGTTLADAWTTRSSFRFKTNIRTLDGALETVERLRGVSYDSKTNGKHEIGVIAEEVGKVLPEVVSYEQNGVDAQGVDYSQLTALLIEAIKQQEVKIQQLSAEIEQLKSTAAH